MPRFEHLKGDTAYYPYSARRGMRARRRRRALLLLSLGLLALALACVPAVFAADVGSATIDETAKGSLTIYKYDLTNGATRS